MTLPHTPRASGAQGATPRRLAFASLLAAGILAAPPLAAQPEPDPARHSAEPSAPAPRPPVEADPIAAPVPRSVGAEPIAAPAAPLTLAVSAAPSASTDAAACMAGEVRAVHQALGPALARVEAPGVRGLGIAVDGAGRVLTAFSIVKPGRGIKVRFWPDDSWRDATVVAADEERGLALLQVEGAPATAFARVAERDSAVGDAVVTMTLATNYDGYRFEQDLVLEPGRVTVAEQSRLRSNALEQRHHRIGAPLLDCSGALVGLSIERRGDESATTSAIRSLLAAAASSEPYDGAWSFAHPSIAFAAQLGHRVTTGFGETDRWFGVRAGTALIGLDQWLFPVRFGLYGLGGPEPDSKLGDRSGVRFQAETGFGYRAMLKGGAIPVYLIPQLTAVLSWERTVLETTDLSLDLGDCTAGLPCPVRATPVRLEDELFRVMPAGSLVLGLGRGELGYQFQLDVEDLDRSVHQITAGFQF